jgi:oligopeptide/dipeptide ABC transporter ATP-binding protein
VGESGCGKSTLARLLMRAERPDAGRVLLNGRDIFAMDGAELRHLRRNVQMVLPDPATSLNPRWTIGDIVGEPFAIHADVAPRGDRKRRVRELLELVGLDPEHINRYPHQFSDGQRQRIGIARALALKPEVIICDESLSALDILRTLRDELRLSCIFMAHNLSEVRHIADRVGVMYLGKLVEIGTEDEIYRHATHPYTQALLSAVLVPDPEARAHREVIRLDGDVPSPSNPPSGCRFRAQCWKAQDRCAHEEPLLIRRAVQPHPSACHYAEVRHVAA